MMSEQKQNGYVIQMYQYARRYRYNYRGSIRYINYLSHKDTDSQNSAYMTLGDFDMLEVTPVTSFRKYFDLSSMARKYLGRRQSILLYCIQDKIMPLRILYDTNKRYWYQEKKEREIPHRFFCLSLLSITNEARSKTDNFLLIKKIREKILNITDRLNEKLEDHEKIVCEIYGTLSATEIGIVWLCNQYVNILLLLDYLKHTKLHFEDTKERIPLFLAFNTTVAVKNDIPSCSNSEDPLKDFNDVKGKVFTQISFHDVLEERSKADEIVQEILSNSEDSDVLYSAGEYDMMIRMPASRALQCIQEGQILNNVKRTERGDCLEKPREILRNNTQVVLEKKRLDEQVSTEVQEELQTIDFLITVQSSNTTPAGVENNDSKWEEWMELSAPDFHEIKDLFEGENIPVKSNYAYYSGIRKKMADSFQSSTGAIDMLDLLYADYLSTIANAYNQIWVSDFHRQFKAVLHAIDLWIDYQKDVTKIETANNKQWKDYSDLTNAFKQQIYHLSQANRMVLEIPRCHFRMTSQYDLLVHTYYGFAKMILKVIYLIQDSERQSELVPLITVNTVPQVNSQLYFEYGSNDGMRVINLNIPAAIMFDLQRGFHYLVHELFHYAVPKSREERNYLMGVFIISESFKMQFIHIFCYMLFTKVDGSVDTKLKKYFTKDVDNFGLSLFVRNLIFTNYTENGEMEFGKYWLDEEILQFIIQNDEDWRKENQVGRGEHDICSTYQKKIYEYCQCERSNTLFMKMSIHLIRHIRRYYSDAFCAKQKKATLQNFKSRCSYCADDDLDKILDRLLYCITDKTFCEHQFMGLREDYANTEKTLLTTKKILWDELREACSDLAMVSLTSMELDDYLLFCIQSWKDANFGEFHAKDLEKEEWLRCILVFKYCLKNAQIHIETLENSFINKYVLFYSKKSDQETDDIDSIIRNRKIYQDAEEWWSEIKRYINSFNSNNNPYSLISFYDNIFFQVLKDFDIKNRMELLDGSSKRKNDLNIILKEIEDKIYNGYHLLSRGLEYKLIREPYPHISLTVGSIEKHTNACFQQNLTIAWYFQRQQSFRELADLNADIQRQQDISQHRHHERHTVSVQHTTLQVSDIFEYNWNFHVRSLQELLFYLQYCENQIQMEDKKKPIWFRGQSNESFKLVPAVMRKYDQDKCKQYKSLRAYQQYEFEKFKGYADGVPEVPNGVRITLSDYIALMQHYFIPTNLLDWSENAFSALYFALENYFEQNGEKKGNVALYILSPGKYNEWYYQKSVDNCKQDESGENNLTKWIQNHVPAPQKWLENSIPNLSTKPNAKTFSAYLLGNLKFDARFELCKEDRKKYEDERIKIRDLCLPVAIWTSRLNSRIRTQSGCFVAFNLYTMPELDKLGIDPHNHTFDYMALENIQNQILNTAHQDKKAGTIFLYKITIDKLCCEEVKNWLQGMGISRSSVYPELELLKNRF